MAVNGPLSGITFAGLSSGIDTESIISRLMQVEQIPLQRLQSRQQDFQSQLSLYGQLSSRLTTISQAAGALNMPGSFSSVTANSSDTAVATVSGSSSASAGVYNLVVTQLAQAHKVASTAQTDTTSALNLTGTFIVNGSAVSVVATDSLGSIAQKINSLGVGVTASLIDGGSGAAYLTMTANSTGASSKVQSADLSGSVLQTLGLLSGGAGSIRETITNGATSVALSDSTTAVGTLLGAPSMAAGTVTINGVSVAIDPSSQGLQAIADAINTASTGATAAVRSVTINGATRYRLDITGGSGTPTFVDDQNILASLGILQNGYGSELVVAQDAKYSLDSVQLTSASNTVTSAIPGVTLTLMKGTVATPGTATLTMTQDASAIKAKINGLVTAYNGSVDFVAQNSSFDTKTFQSGPLFGDPIVQQVQDSMSGMLFNNVPGLTGKYTNLASIGFSLGDDGKLSVDDAALTSALSSAPDSVAALFKSMGSSANSNLTFIAATSKTKPSGSTPYAVSITQLATQGSYSGELAQTSANSASETLTFSGALFGATPYKLILDVGSTASAAVSKINNDATLRNFVVAALDGSGKLQVTSKRYGTNGNFTLVSNITAATDNSGIGVGSLGTVVAGVDVLGTINGEAATGAGQSLTGKAGNLTTDGLQILYSGTQLGSVGTISFTKGLAAQFSDLVGQFTDPTGGLLSASNNELQTQIDQITSDITDLQAALAQKQADLRLKFANMEQTLATLQQQSAQLASLIAPTSTK